MLEEGHLVRDSNNRRMKEKSDHGSTANRRVSFAPEATLHTWNVVELPEDSTTSSASTNSTRRASGLTANTVSPYAGPRSAIPSSDIAEPPSTPPEQIEETQVAASPAHQRDLHQKKRRRSSVTPSINFNDPNQSSSSPYSGDSGDDTGTQGFETVDEGSCSSDSDDKDLVKDETLTNVDGDNNTVHSSADSTGSSGRLEAALQQAANQAGTKGIDYDENGDITMEMADDEITNAFKPWVYEENQAQNGGNPSTLSDQENVNPFSPAFKADLIKKAVEDDDRTMEITQAVGGIIPAGEGRQGSPKRRRRRSITGPNRRKSSVAGRRSPGNESTVDGDETMDLTTAIGGIQHDQTHQEAGSGDEDEELTMEITSVVGGVVQPICKGPDATPKSQSSIQTHNPGNHRQSAGSVDGEENMEVTYVAGGILLPSITERTEPPEDRTMDMDITTAVGSLLPDQLSTGNKAEAKALLERETDAGHLITVSPFKIESGQQPVGAGLLDERPLPTQVCKSTVASDTGSPSLAASQTRNGSRVGMGQRQSLTPQSRQPTPMKKPGTPSKQLTPQSIRPTTPGKTPPSKNVAMRTASPKKLFKAEIKSAKKEAETSGPKSDVPNPLFRHDLTIGITTPSIILQPRKRRSSSLGIDHESFGSPRVTALLERRGSIGEKAKAFVVPRNPSSIVRFEDPRVMEQELDQERAEEKRRESGRGILQGEADDQDLQEKDATTNLKDLIGSLTPQKRKEKKLNGRKSLHVGAAKGLLGKRPVELDEDEDEDEDLTPKRLKSREESPVKKVTLPAPPSKAATTGRITRSTRLSLAENAANVRSSTPSGSFPLSKNNTTPKDQSRFKNVEVKSPANAISFEENLGGPDDAAGLKEEEEDRIRLQDFLNMTSIRFMELTTTKRRHTVLPHAIEQSARKTAQGAGEGNQPDSSNNLENCVVAGVCTVPMLELYQHVSSTGTLRFFPNEGAHVCLVLQRAEELYFRRPQSCQRD